MKKRKELMESILGKKLSQIIKKTFPEETTESQSLNIEEAENLNQKKNTFILYLVFLNLLVKHQSVTILKTCKELKIDSNSFVKKFSENVEQDLNVKKFLQKINQIKETLEENGKITKRKIEKTFNE